MRGVLSSRGGGKKRIPPPSVPPLQPGHHHRPSTTSPSIPFGFFPRYPIIPAVPMDERHPRVHDNEQSTSGLSVEQHQQISRHPTQLQYQGQTQAYLHRNGVQQRSASFTQQGHGDGGESCTDSSPICRNSPATPLSQPPQICGNPSNASSSQPSQICGNSSTSAGPSNSHYIRTDAYERVLAQIYSTPLPPTAPTSGVSTQDQGQYYGHSGPTAYPQVVQMQPYPQQLYNSPTYATPAEVVSQTNAPSSHIPPWINPTASGENPNSGAGPSGSNVNISGTSGEPTPFNQQIGPSRGNKTNRRQLSKPYQRPTSAPRKTRPITHERNLVRLQQRCRRQGADEVAIGLLGKIFPNQVSLEALTRQLTDTEAETKEFGIDNGKVYNALLEYLNEEDDVVARYNCRLCHSEQTWKHHRDVLRHLRRDHFGLADVCDQWYVFDRSLM